MTSQATESAGVQTLHPLLRSATAAGIHSVEGLGGLGGAAVPAVGHAAGAGAAAAHVVGEGAIAAALARPRWTKKRSSSECTQASG